MKRNDEAESGAVVSSTPLLDQLRVWWIPQVPGKSFTVDVADISEAKLLLKVLADYDIFQYRNRIKPDYCNAGGLQTWDGEEWVDWHDKDGNDIGETGKEGSDVGEIDEDSNDIGETERLVRCSRQFLEIVGLRCGLLHKLSGQRPCGGTLRVEDFYPKAVNGGRYEIFCVRCGAHDPNGWARQDQILPAARKYFEAKYQAPNG